MYRGNYHNINPSNSRRDSSAICRYLYTPIAIRYFQKVFPELGELSESEISGIFKSPVNADNSGTKPTKKEGLSGDKTVKVDGETTTGDGEGVKKESPINAGTLENQVTEITDKPLKNDTTLGEEVREISHDKDVDVVAMGAK
jgi:hypothetical protein